MKLLSQGQWTLLKLIATAVVKVSACSFPSSLSPNFHVVIERMPGDTCTLWIALQENNYELMEHKPFYNKQ